MFYFLQKSARNWQLWFFEHSFPAFFWLKKKSLWMYSQMNHGLFWRESCKKKLEFDPKRLFKKCRLIFTTVILFRTFLNNPKSALSKTKKVNFWKWRNWVFDEEREQRAIFLLSWNIDVGGNLTRQDQKRVASVPQSANIISNMHSQKTANPFFKKNTNFF